MFRSSELPTRLEMLVLFPFYLLLSHLLFCLPLALVAFSSSDEPSECCSACPPTSVDLSNSLSDSNNQPKLWFLATCRVLAQALDEFQFMGFTKPSCSHLVSLMMETSNAEPPGYLKIKKPDRCTPYLWRSFPSQWHHNITFIHFLKSDFPFIPSWISKCAFSHKFSPKTLNKFLGRCPQTWRSVT